MKKVLFFNHMINHRGGTNAILDYAHFNQTILGNESSIIYNSYNKDNNPDMASDENLVKSIAKTYNIISYNAGPYDDFSRINDIASNYDLFYAYTAGKPENPQLSIKSTKVANHVVFQNNSKFGDYYAYISEWLSLHCSGGTHSFIPHIVTQPSPNKDLRKELGIPKDKFVFGRHGGYSTFDNPFVRKAVINISTTRSDIVFLLVNTEKFYDHPNIIHLPAFFGDQEKSNFINACDAMIHGRLLGESFGLAICDFLFWNKPVLAWEGGYDQNHTLLLQKYGLLYDERNIIPKMLDLKNYAKGKDFKQIVDPFTPDKVMAKFDEVFLK